MSGMKSILGDKPPPWAQQQSQAFARNTDPQTARDAADSITPIVTDLEAAVLAALKTAPRGLTLDELIDATGLEKVTVSPRLRPLCVKGYAKELGKKPGRSGRQQTIWGAT
ncbi:MAG: helix-turn-helix domain-containing protein [Methyloceanibacter sp.]